MHKEDFLHRLGVCRTNTLVSVIREKLNLTVGERYVNCKDCFISREMWSAAHDGLKKAKQN